MEGRRTMSQDDEDGGAAHDRGVATRRAAAARRVVPTPTATSTATATTSPRPSKRAGVTTTFRPDPDTPFPSYFVQAKTKVEKRKKIAALFTSWIRLQHRRGATGAIVFDIDDTVVDGREAVRNGFETMHDLFDEACFLYPVYFVTARPDDTHEATMEMLKEKKFCVPPDRLRMLPAHLWGKEDKHVESFKWNETVRIAAIHKGIVARFGDRMWDVATEESLHTTLRHVGHREAYAFMDPTLAGAVSAKLPG